MGVVGTAGFCCWPEHNRPILLGGRNPDGFGMPLRDTEDDTLSKDVTLALNALFNEPSAGFGGSVLLLSGDLLSFGVDSLIFYCFRYI